MPVAVPLGVFLTKWTIRLALACFVVYVAGGIAARGARWQRVGRRVWTAGCGLFLVHVACAFHFYHQWSHAAAWRSTAEQTEQLLGVAFGGGIYFSYVFLVLWVLDVLWLWTTGSPATCVAGSATGVPLGPPYRDVTPWWRVVVHLFLLFIAFNGAIVFEDGPTRWAGIVACCGLAVLAGHRGYNLYVRQLQRPDCEMIHEAADSGGSAEKRLDKATV